MRDLGPKGARKGLSIRIGPDHVDPESETIVHLGFPKMWFRCPFTVFVRIFNSVRSPCFRPGAGVSDLLPGRQDLRFRAAPPEPRAGVMCGDLPNFPQPPYGSPGRGERELLPARPEASAQDFFDRRRSRGSERGARSRRRRARRRTVTSGFGPNLRSRRPAPGLNLTIMPGSHPSPARRPRAASAARQLI